MAPKPSTTTEAPINTDATDPKTIAANNGSGPTVPSNGTDTHIADLFAGLGIDPDAPITTVTRTPRGRQVPPLETRETNLLQRGIDAVVGGSVAGFPFPVTNNALLSTKNKMNKWVADHAPEGVFLKVTFATHEKSVNRTSVKPEDKDKLIIAVATVTVDEEAAKAAEAAEPVSA